MRKRILVKETIYTTHAIEVELEEDMIDDIIDTLEVDRLEDLSDVLRIIKNIEDVEIIGMEEECNYEVDDIEIDYEEI